MSNEKLSRSQMIKAIISKFENHDDVFIPLSKPLPKILHFGFNGFEYLYLTRILYKIRGHDGKHLIKAISFIGEYPKNKNNNVIIEINIKELSDKEVSLRRTAYCSEISVSLLLRKKGYAYKRRDFGGHYVLLGT